VDKTKIDKFCDRIYQAGLVKTVATASRPDPFEPHIYPFQNLEQDRYVKFEAQGIEPFFGYWQQSFRTQAPLVVHLPGYGAEMSMHPELTDSFHVLHVSPLGLCMPSGRDKSKMTFGGLSSVLPDTIASNGANGYYDWLVCVSIAIRWAWGQSNVIPNRVSFFGTSQGGGGALLMGSVFRQRGTACVVADQPFLTNFELAKERGAYGSLVGKHTIPKADIDKTLFCFDTVNHSDRYNFPIALSAGGKDEACPFDTVESLFGLLKGTKSYTLFDHLPHGYSREALNLAKAWLTIYA